MDFFVAFPKLDWCESIMIVVDRFNKYATFIPTPTNCQVDEVVHLFLKNVMKLWGVS